MKFIWISGSINSGKSTLAAALNKRIKKSVNIECDDLRHFATHEKLEVIGDYISTDALDLAKKWIARGYLPIITWPMWRDGLNKLFDYSKKLGIEPVLINLTPDKETAKQNRGGRELTEREFNRIEYMYEIENIKNPATGHSIDNTNQTIDETVNEAMKIIEEIAKPYS
jgi:uridine kinase